jgi:phytoene synthase
LVKRARAHYDKADEIMSRNKRSAVKAPRIMSKYYRKILELLVARGFALPRDPVRLGKASKIAILLQYGIV